MDEFLFRSSQKLENFQYQFGNAAVEGKRLLGEQSTKWKDCFVSYVNSPQSVELRNYVRELWFQFLAVADEVKCTVFYYVNPRKLLNSLKKVFMSKWSKRDIYIICIGIVIGGVIGVTIGISMQDPPKVLRHVKAVQCTISNENNTEYILSVEDSTISSTCAQNEVLISVKAASIQVIDAEICRGYGRTLRKLLNHNLPCTKHDLPVTLGRDCAGVVVDIGQRVTRFEIGDEVWTTVPFWSTGTLSEYVLVPDYKVSKKPSVVGFEGACTLAFAGSLALKALEHCKLTPHNAINKRIFVQGGCTPIGCVLIQVLKNWGAHITTNCNERASPVARALGASDLIITDQARERTKDDLNVTTIEEQAKLLIKELELRDKFDVIINTRKCGINEDVFRVYCRNYYTTNQRQLVSDSYGSIMTLFFYGYLKIKTIFYRNILGYKFYDFDDLNLSFKSLDILHEMVLNGELRTLVEKVFHPGDVQKALNHIESNDSIGSTIITFR